MRHYYSSGLILNAVCRAFDTTIQQLLAPGRLQRNADARQAAAYLMRHRGNVAPCDIVRLLGKGERWAFWAHATAKQRMERDRQFRAGVERADLLLTGEEVAA